MADINKPLNIAATPPPSIIPTNPLTSVSVGSGALLARLPSTSPVIGKADVITIAVALRGLGEENIPDPRLFKFIADKLGADEVSLLAAYKQVPDLVKGTDITSILARKVLLEVKTLREELLLQTKTDRYDQVLSTDMLSQRLSKPFTDAVAKADTVLSKGAGKGLLETKTVVDVFSKHIGILLAEIDYWLQDYGASGYTERAVHTQDALSRIVNYKRTLNSLADATDDFYGLANLDDDQLAAFHKVLADWAEVSEALVFWTRKTLADSAHAVEQLVFASGTKLATALTLPDTGIATVAGKALQSASAAADTLVRLASKVADEDRVLPYGKVTKRAGKNLVTGFSKADVLTLTPKPVKLDSFATLDSAKFSTGKGLVTGFTKADVLTLTPKPVKLDSFATLDSAKFSTGKNLVTGFTKADVLTLTPKPVKLDSFATLDSTKSATGKGLLSAGTLTDKPVFSAGRLLTDRLVGTLDAVTRQYYKNIEVTGYFLKDYVGTEYGTASEKAIFASDHFSRVVIFSRSVADFVDATDDIYGAASIDDDQVAMFGKGLVEYLQLGETITKTASFIRGFTDSGEVADSRALGVGRSSIEAVSAIEVFARQVQFIRNVTSTSTTSEIRYSVAAKAINTTTGASDVASSHSQFLRSFASSGSLSETKAFWSQSRLLDTSAVLESSTRKSIKYLQDGTNTSQTLNLNVQNYLLERYAAVDYVGQTFVY